MRVRAILYGIGQNDEKFLGNFFFHFCPAKSFYKLPIFYLPTGDTTKSAEDREVKEEEEGEEEEEEE
jgi:hypothetical protein